MADPRRPNKVLRYKPPASDNNPTLEDPTPDYMNLLGMIFSMCGLMLKFEVVCLDRCLLLFYQLCKLPAVLKTQSK